MISLFFKRLRDIFAFLDKLYPFRKCILLIFLVCVACRLPAQGNRLSILSTPPKALSICGINDSAFIEIYNITAGTVSGITVKLQLAPGINYVKNSVSGTGISESNISNLNQPVFSAPNLLIAKNFKFRVLLSSDCNLLPYLNANNTPAINVRADYTGNFDLGASIPFSVKVPSVQFGSITNLSYTGDIGSVFGRFITIGNYGKGPLKEIKLTRINGKDIRTYFVSKGITSTSGDTVTTIFNSAFFKTVGNLDTFLDQNETISFTDSSQVKGCKSLTTNFELSWGCNGKTCQVSKTSGSVIISNRTPNLIAIPLPVTPTCFNNVTFKSELRFVNTGNMPASKPRVSISLNYPYMTSTFDTASVRIRVGSTKKWVKAAFDSVTSTYNLGYYGCIGLYPVGLFRLRSPDLLPNDTLFITWDTRTCTPPPCTNNIYVVNSWAYSAEYRDQCSNVKTIPWTWGKVYDYHHFVSSSFSPTDLVNGQTGEFRLLVSAITLLPRTSKASYVVDLILPKGLTHSKLKKDLYFINADLNGNWNPDSIVIKSDTLRAYFPHPVPIDLMNAELVFYLKADCSKSGTNGINNIGLQIRYNPDPKCNPAEWHYLTCQTLATKVHCISNCNGGMRFRDFSVQRISFGKPDNNNDGIPDGSGGLDTLKVREERCFVGDTLLAVYTGIVKRTSSITTWRNAYVESLVSNGSNLDIASVQLLVYRRGVTLSLSCSQVKSWKTLIGANARFKFDLSTDSLLSCASSSFRYSNDDSIIVKVKYRVSKNIGGTIVNVFYDNSFYTSNINNPTSWSNKFQCDTFSGQMIMTGYYFTSCCSDVYQVNSCSQLAVNNYFYLGIGTCCSNYGGNNYFPYEYRNFAKLKSVKFSMPPGFRFKSAILGQYRTSGSNKTTLENKDSIKPVNINASPLVFDVSRYYKDSAKGTISLSDDGFHGYYVAYIEPSCEIQGNGPHPLKYDFVFERKNTLGAGFDTISGAGNDQVIYNKPVTSIKPTSPIIYAATDTAEWEVIYTNYSPTFSNINTWFAPDNSGAIKIVQIKDMSKDTLLPVSNGVFRAGLMPFNNTRKFRIRAVYNSCSKDSVILYSGWNCQGYPKDLASYACQKERIALYLEPQNTQYQATLTDSITTAPLCANTPYVYTLENIGATPGYNTMAILNLPIGMTVLPGSCFLKYPHKNSKVAIPAPALKSGTTYEWNLSALSSGIASGFKGVSDTSRNRIIIYFRVKTDCDYSSGNYIRASASGNIKCGNPIVTYPAISNPLNIIGVTRPYYTLLKVESDSIFPCEKATRVKVRIINLGPGKTGIEDKYQALLLKGMQYDSTLYAKIYNSPDNSLTKTRNINGATEIEYSLNKDIVPGDSMEFIFGYNSDGQSLNCGPADFYSQSAVKQEVICIVDNSKCKINVVTGNSFIKPEVVKGSLFFSNLKADILSTTSDSETLKIQYTITNAGNKINSNKPLVYKIVYDLNGSGTVDRNDLVTRIDTISLALAKNAFTNRSKTISVKAGLSCALFIVLDSASCSCSFAYAKFPVPPLRNAGGPKNVCSGEKIMLGTQKIRGFRYLWSPGTELDSDTIAQPSAFIQNFDTASIARKFVLTTYRGACASRDTTDVKIFNQPEIFMIQKDTSLCEGKSVMLKAGSRKGTGMHMITWKPGLMVSDSTKFLTQSKASKSIKYRATVTDSKGCKAIDSMSVLIKPVPKAKFGFPESCQGVPLQLKDSSSITGDSIVFNKWYGLGADTVNAAQWNFDIGNNLQASVKLEVKSLSGCWDSVRRTVFVNPLPKADFSFINVCFGDSSRVKNLSSVSSGSIVKSGWDAGDGKAFVKLQFNHVYSSADTFLVRLSIETGKACRDTVQKPVIVYPRPLADFSVGDVCLHDSSRFINLSTVGNDTILQHIWSADLNVSNMPDPVFIFTKDTSYKVRLKVISSMGCSDSISRIANVYTNPVAGFKVDNVCEFQSTSIHDLSKSAKGKISSWIYSLSDGTSYSSADFTHKFKTGDTFDIVQVVSSDKACRDTIGKQAIVYPKLVPDFSYNDICVSGDVVLTDKTSYVNTSIKSWKWRFTPGDSSGLQNPVFRYPKWGFYNISLQVVSAEGCSFDTVQKITVYPLPLVDFKDTNQCIDNRFNFSSILSIPYGAISKVDWSFGDNTFSSVLNPFHAFPAAGKYNVRLIAESGVGCRDSAIKQVSSYPPVVVDFDWKNVCLGDVMDFTDKSLVPNSTIKSYNWDFGDGSSAKIKDPSHLFKSFDSFMVKLAIVTAYNCKYDSFHYVEVYPVPVAMFSTDPDHGTIVNPEIQISDESSGADSIRYSLGDGTFSVMRNLVRNYPDSGTYYIRQLALNNYGCVDSFTKKIVIKYLFVFNAPTAFSPNNDAINDSYGPGGIGISNYAMSIFNRWGELVYITDNGVPWDGTYQGEPVMDGVYAVSFRVRDFRGMWHYESTSFVLLR
jgi:gliding motility-associated-like protein